jgi:PEP-CTERM motif
MSPAPRRCILGRPALALFLAAVCSAVSLPLVTAVPPAAADPIVLIDTFGPGDTYDIGGVDTPWMPVAPSPFLIGFRFTPAIDVRLSEVTIAAASLLSDVRTFFPGQSPPATALQFSIRSTVNGVPGAALETFEYAELPLFDQLNPVFSATSEQQPLLGAGLPYWLTASGTDGWAVWNLNSIGHRGPVAITEDFGPCCTIFDDAPTGAFRVTGTPSAAPVPEPTSMLLFGTGLAALGARRWRQRKA